VVDHAPVRAPDPKRGAADDCGIAAADVVAVGGGGEDEDEDGEGGGGAWGGEGGAFGDG